MGCSLSEEPFPNVIASCGGGGDGRQAYARVLALAEAVEVGVPSTIEYVNQEQEEGRWQPAASQDVIVSLVRVREAAEGIGDLGTPTPETQERIGERLEELHDKMTAEYTEAVDLGLELLDRVKEADRKDRKELVEEFQTRFTHGGLAEDVGRLSNIVHPGCA